MADKPVFVMVRPDTESDPVPHYAQVSEIESFFGQNGQTCLQMVSGKHHWVDMDVQAFINLIDARVLG